MRFFFFNDTATTEIYTLSLHDALPIFRERVLAAVAESPTPVRCVVVAAAPVTSIDVTAADALTELDDALLAQGVELRFAEDRKSTRLNSSHANISYAVFCLKTNTPIKT